MASIVTHKFRQFNADQFYESLSEAGPSYLYMFIGGIRAWGNDASPPSPSDALANTEFDFWNDMLSAKRVTSADSSYAVPRKDWATTVVYNEYDQRNPNLFSSSNGHYVMTTDYNVYKCLFNNNGQGSVTKPTGTLSTVLSTADGYKWKYMYTISAADALKFVTDDYIPVKRIGATDNSSNQWDVEQAAANGSIDIIDVSAGGSATKVAWNTGTLATVTSNASFTLPAGAAAVQGLYTGSVLYLTGGTGSGQQANIISYSAGRVVTITEPFSTTPTTATTYSVAPKVQIQGDGRNAEAICTMNTTSNTVYSVTMTDVGLNYSKGTVTISANGLSAVTAVAYIPPPGGHGNNAIKELGGYNVMINAQFDKTESGTFTVSNDFRKIGLLRDPNIANGSTATGTRYDQTTRLTITGISGTFTADELLTGGTTGAGGYVVEANTTVIHVTSANTNFSNSEVVTGGSSSATATVTSTIANGDMQPYSGELMYSDFRSPISRAADQIEDTKLIISF